MAEFLFSDVNGESLAGVYWFVEFVEVVVDLGLVDFCVISHDVVIDVVYGDPVYPSSGSSSAAITHSANAAAPMLTVVCPVWTYLAQWTYNTLCSAQRQSRSSVFATGSMSG